MVVVTQEEKEETTNKERNGIETIYIYIQYIYVRHAASRVSGTFPQRLKCHIDFYWRLAIIWLRLLLLLSAAASGAPFPRNLVLRLLRYTAK